MEGVLQKKFYVRERIPLRRFFLLGMTTLSRLMIIHDHEASSDGDCACRFRRIIVGCWLQLRANVTGACQFLQVAAGCARGGIQSRDGLARTMSWTLWRAAFVTAARARDYHKAARRNCCYWQ